MIEISNSRGLDTVMNALASDDDLLAIEKLNIYNCISNIINSLFNFENPEFEKYALNFNKLKEMKNDLLSKIYYAEKNDILNELKIGYGIKINSYEYYFYINNSENNNIAIVLFYLINEDIGYFLIIPKNNLYYEDFVSKLNIEYLYEFKEDI